MDELAQMDQELEALAQHQRESPRASPPLPASFEVEAVVDEVASKAAGKTVYRDQEIVTIKVSPNATRRRVVTDDDRRMYAAQYLAWKKNSAPGEGLEGYPLGQWAMLPGKAVAKQFADYGIRTIEQLAAATDATVQHVGPFLNLREQAREWVKGAQTQAPLAKLREENAALKHRLDTLEEMLGQAQKELGAARASGGVLPAGPDPRMEAMQAQIAALAAAVAQKPVEAPPNGAKRRGRPPGTKNKPKDPAPEA